MEKKLSRLMDFQRFENSPRLKALIQETEARYTAQALSEDALSWVNAAGNIDALNKLDHADD